MIRTLARGLFILSALNFLAIAGFVGWLGATHRLDAARVVAIRDLLAPTIEQAEAHAQSAAAAAEEEARAAAEAQQARDPAPPSAMQVAHQNRLDQALVDHSRRTARDLEDLERQLLDVQAALSRERAEFETERTAWRAERDSTINAAADAQFQRVVKMLEDIPARQAKDFLAHLAQTGGLEQAVIYLNAMKPYNASEVIKAFKPEERQLATDLLQRMRALGSSSASAGAPPDADAAGDPG